MLAKEIKVGGTYVAKVSGDLTTVRVDAIREHRGIKQDRTVYDVTNLTTGRKTTFRSAQKFRRAVTTVADMRAKGYTLTRCQVREIKGYDESGNPSNGWTGDRGFGTEDAAR